MDSKRIAWVSSRGCVDASAARVVPMVPPCIEDLPPAERERILRENRARLQAEGVTFARLEDLLSDDA